MTVAEYVRHFFGALDYNPDFKGKYRWNIQTISDTHMEATASVPTVAGAKTMTIVFNDDFLFPTIVLAEGVSPDDVSQDVLWDIMVKMNDVNWLYGNAIVAFVNQGDNGFNFYLRGSQQGMYRKKCTSMAREEWISVLSQAMTSVTSFIASLVESFDTDCLRDLFECFEG